MKISNSEDNAMDKDILVLKDGTAVELEAGANLFNMQVRSANKAGMVNVWDKLTAGNLAKAQVKNGAGLVVGNYTDLELVSETSIVQPDGTILTSFCLREKDALEKRIEAVENGQAVQDGAIMDMAEVLSTVAE